jgi:lactate permease
LSRIQGNLRPGGSSSRVPGGGHARGFVTPAGPGRTIPIFRHPGAILTYSSVLAFLIYKAAGLYKPGATGRVIKGYRQQGHVLQRQYCVHGCDGRDHGARRDDRNPCTGPGQQHGEGFSSGSPLDRGFGGLHDRQQYKLQCSVWCAAATHFRAARLPAALILAGQTAGAALASVMAPTKVVVGASTAGMAGQEGDIMRKIMVYTGLLVLLISLLTMGSVLLDYNGIGW